MTTNTKTTWRTVRLGDVASKITKGTTPTTMGRRFISSGINFIKAESITDDSKFIPSKFEHIDEDTNAALKRSIIQENDILYSIAGVIGRPALVRNEILPANTNQALAIIRPDLDKIEPRYLFYFLSTKAQKKFANNLVAQSAQPNINLEQVSNLEFPAPALEEQRRIVEVLSSLDDKIENNSRIAKTLEEMAQAIFKEWFVGFRYPGHGKAEFIDSELGKIPKGWEVKKFSDVAHLNKGVSYSSKEIAAKDGGLPMINLANFLRGGGFNADGVKHYTGEYKDSHLVKPGQIVVAMTDLTSNREVIGHPARVPEDFEKALISLDVCSVSTEDIYVEFLYSAMLRREFSQLMAGSASGTNVSHLSKTNIENYILLLPNRDLLSKFSELIRPMFTMQINLEAESRKLAAMRDFLLPRLMSGEIQV